jgi:hypothetical protein
LAYSPATQDGPSWTSDDVDQCPSSTLEMSGNPSGDGACRLLGRSGARVDTVGDALSKPSAKLALLGQVAPAPWRSVREAGASHLIGTIEQKEVNVSDPTARLLSHQSAVLPPFSDTVDPLTCRWAAERLGQAEPADGDRAQLVVSALRP